MKKRIIIIIIILILIGIIYINSDKYFISLEDTLKTTLKSEDIVLKHKDYEVNATNKRVVIKYRDTENKDKWKLTLHIDTDGKQLLFFDK